MKTTLQEQDNNLRSHKKDRIAVSLLSLTLISKFFMELFALNDWSPSFIYTFMGLYAVSSILLSIWILMNKRVLNLYKILGVFGVVLLMYTSYRFVFGV